MDAAGVERAVVVGLSAGALWGVLLAAEHPERVAAAVFIAAAAPFAQHAARVSTPFDEPLESYEGWAKYNRHYWLEDYRDFLEFFFGQVFTEPHSTKQIEDCVGVGPGDDAGDARAHLSRPPAARPGGVHAPLRAHRVPGAGDPRDRGRGPAVRGGRRARAGRPVERSSRWRAPGTARTRATRCASTACSASSSARSRRRAAGRADAAVASARSTSPRRSGSATPGATSRSPASCAACTPTSRSTGSRSTPSPRRSTPPASACIRRAALLANESHHIESESAEHDLHCFQAWRRMDEILVANFMVFDDVVREQQYDLWIADEGWEIDYYLHENPECKRAAYAWLTDFVGWLPMPDGGEHEAALTADYNAEMIEQIARFPRVRDRAIFVGNRDDIVPEAFGPGLPEIAEWTTDHYAFAGHVTGFDPGDVSDRERLRAELGYAPGEQVCVVSVGGSGVGRALLERVMAAFPQRARAGAGAAHDRRRRAADRPGVASRARRAGGARLRPRPLPPPRRLRPRRRPGRPHHGHGADREPAAVPLLPPAPPLRAELPRPPPARALPRGTPDGLRHCDAGVDRRWRSPRRSGARSTTYRSRPTAPPPRPP